MITDISNNRQRTFLSVAGVPFTATSLSPYSTYIYVVAAATVNGTGPFSISASVTTNETGKRYGKTYLVEEC